ncbi:MAG: nucleotidyl transferase AbiEii/AbiGii toxin family protein [Pyrinomonadaceae bacterium]
MDKVALLPANERNELFEESARRRGVLPAITEKDFWVCWVLKKLFESKEISQHLVFKGGTSLSKVYGVIDRFSEDIDLIIDWGLLGYGKDGDNPWAEKPTSSKLDKFNKEFNERAKEYIRDSLFNEVAGLLAVCPSVSLAIRESDGQIIDITYPSSFKAESLRPAILLEIGPLASWVPSIKGEITPFAAEDFPEVFQDPKCVVTTITAERTFWEKATILHQQAHRKTDMPKGYSRHYYDLFRLSASPFKDKALADLDLLTDVVRFKERFYRSSWARYDLAKPGSFRLLPTEQGDTELQKDFLAMQPMIFRSPPTWTEIISGLAKLEAEINDGTV